MREIKRCIAKDGKIFEGFDAERQCKAHERWLRADEIKENFKEIDIKEIKVPIAFWWYGDCAKGFKVTLKSKHEYETLLDYFYEFEDVWDGYPEPIMKEPENYPYTTIIGRGEEWAYEYNIEDYKRDLQMMLEAMEG